MPSTSGLNEGLHPSFTAREATVEDLEELLEFFFAIFREPEFNEKSKGFALFETMRFRYQSDPSKHEREFFGRDINRRFALVVQDRKTGRLVGTAWLISNLDFEPEDDIGEINKIYLSPECRGKGLGLWLMNKMINQARLLGFRRLSLITGLERACALSLYTSLGFVPAKQGRYSDSPNTIAMSYDLAIN